MGADQNITANWTYDAGGHKSALHAINPVTGEQITGYSYGVTDEVENVYNDFWQLQQQYQEHSGAVNTSTSPSVQYAYADGSANTVRPTGITYPNGNALNFGYGASTDPDYLLSRINSLFRGLTCSRNTTSSAWARR